MGAVIRAALAGWGGGGVGCVPEAGFHSLARDCRVAEKLGYRTYNLSRWIFHTNCIAIQSLHVYVRINVS